MKKLIILALILSSNLTISQFRNRPPEWTTKWITAPEINATDSGLFLFRKEFNLTQLPEKLNVKVSGDNRFKLYVNESLVSIGPSIGDLDHWNYELVDIKPYLKEGANVIAAEVWNEGSFKPVNQFSYQTAFIIQAEEDAGAIVNSDEGWKCIQDISFTPLRQSVPGYYAAGAGQFVDMNLSIKPNWKSISFDASSWTAAELIYRESAGGMGFFRRQGWKLQPSIIPNMELKNERLVSTRRATGTQIPKKFPAEKKPVVIEKNTTASILLDQSYLTNAFFTLKFSEGKGANINVRYAESLYEKGEERRRSKGNRNEVENKIIIGRLDSLVSNGTKMQEFTSLSYRTYRYVQLDVETKDQDLVIDDVYGTFVGYPFEMNAKIESEKPEIEKMMEIGWRTSRLCAVDTYMDCPYYERLQYVGDTRIQMMVSYYNSGDDRLAKNAINLIDQSRQPDGYTLSRYPDTQNQVIPTYSLWHVSTLYDYMLYGKDPDFVKSKLLGARQIMNYFISFIDEDGSIKNIPGWNYTDWVPEWGRGTGPMSEDGSSSILDLQLLHALLSAIEIEKFAGTTEYVNLYESITEKLKSTIAEKYWDENRQLYADTPKKDTFSQHANSLAILAGIVDNNKALNIAQSMLNDKTLAPASIYFSYYLHLALAEAGLGSQYLDWLDVWREYIDLGMSTWGETSQVLTTRSDAHAWGASPNIEFFRIILGIQSVGPQFSKVLIKPNIEAFENISGKIPHPNGEISVVYTKKKGQLNAQIILPENVSGIFQMNGKTLDLVGGSNNLSL
ncbi:MAG: family 78 glycoside hydrolase catalytic domain [Flavobacteriaceae bacterium]